MAVPSAKDLLAIAPQLILAFFGMLVLLLDAVWPKISKRLLANLAVLGMLITIGVTWAYWPRTSTLVMQGMVAADSFTAFFTVALAIAGILSVWLSVHYLDQERANLGEYYALILFTTFGGVVMAASVNLICVFIGLEILSIALYILAGYRSDQRESDESALKYFLLGSFASAFFLYGIALIYGATGTINLQQIGQNIDTLALTGMQPGKHYLLLAGIALLLVGFGFKVAVVPFHVWMPDVYEGAPTPVTAFMSVTAKVAGFAAFLRALAAGFQVQNDQNIQVYMSAVLASIAALTMLVGNVVACVQTNLKRLLAYSSIAHAGYILVGLVAAVRPGSPLSSNNNAQAAAISAVLFYSLTYIVSNLGAFGVVLALRKKGREIQDISDLSGIGYKYPLLGALMTLFLLSLAGLPLLAGFFGKLFLLNAVIGQISSASPETLIWLVVVFALTSVVSFYYYLAPVRAMYMDRPEGDEGEETVLSADWHLKLALGLCALGTIFLGVAASPALGLTQRVANSFFTAGGPFSAMR